ncbi:MAG: hypothetical protein V3S27_08780 [Kiloniellales bacterium]
MGRLFALMLAAALLGACGAFAPRDGLPEGWYRPAPDVGLAARYCYRTLAEVDCHAQALTAEANRRVGFFDHPVAR